MLCCASKEGTMDITVITREALEAAGYRPYPNPLRNDDWNAVLFQKRFKDEHGTRYFIDLIEYDWQKVAHFRDGPRFTYEPTISIYTGDGDTLFRMIVQDHAACASIRVLEMFVLEVWTKLGAGYYELDDPA